MIAWAIETLVASTLLMLLVLAIRGPVRRAVGPGLAYALWLLPVLRMLLPPLPGDWTLGRLIAPWTQTAVEAPGVSFGVLNADRLPPELVDAALLQTQVEVAGHQANIAVVPPTAVAGAPSIALLLVGLWALGALAFFAYHWIAHGRFCARLRRHSRVTRMVAGGKVHLLETDATQGPLAFGVWRKYVAFPRDFRERYDAVERDLALAHELGHHARGDLLANWVALVVLALHWFNPVAWRAFRAFRADQEMACDALVLSGRARTLRHAYGRAIVKSAHGGAVSAACHLHTINDVKGRLRMLTTTRRATRTQLFAGVAALGGLTIGALALTASGSAATTRIRTHVEETIATETAATQAAPAMPAPPAVAQVPVPPSSVAPAASPAPPAPPAPPVAAKDGEPGVHVSEWTDADGRRHVVRTIHRVRPADGKQAGTDADVHVRTFVDGDREMRLALRAVPEVSSINCGPGVNMVERAQDGEKRKIIICTDRIELKAKNAETQAELGKMHAQVAMQGAMIGLRMARRSIESESALSDSQRKEALEGIDHAMREIERGKKD